MEICSDISRRSGDIAVEPQRMPAARRPYPGGLRSRSQADAGCRIRRELLNGARAFWTAAAAPLSECLRVVRRRRARCWFRKRQSTGALQNAVALRTNLRGVRKFFRLALQRKELL